MHCSALSSKGVDTASWQIGVATSAVGLFGLSEERMRLYDV